MPIIISDNIEQECLDLISLFRDSEYIKKHLLLHYKNLSEEKLKSVSNDVQSYIVQAISFLQETDDRIMTAPLTLFYAVCNFAKAIYYIHYPNLILKGGHGLTFDNNAAEGIKELGTASATVLSSGTFVGLIDVTGDPISSGQKYTCKDLFSIIPELCEVYALRYFEEPNVFLMKKYKNKDRCYDLLFQNKDGDKAIGQRFSLPGDKGLRVLSTPSGSTLFRAETCSEEDFNKTTYLDVHGNRYLTTGIFNGTQYFKMSKIIALYLTYYIFSMLARYFPEEWLRLCESADSAIIRRLVIHLRREMLVEVVRYLSGKDYTYETKLPVEDSELDIHELWQKLKKEDYSERRRSGGRYSDSIF